VFARHRANRLQTTYMRRMTVDNVLSASSGHGHIRFDLNRNWILDDNEYFISPDVFDKSNLTVTHTVLALLSALKKNRPFVPNSVFNACARFPLSLYARKRNAVRDE